jgi:hypothetical protein
MELIKERSSGVETWKDPSRIKGRACDGMSKIWLMDDGGLWYTRKRNFELVTCTPENESQFLVQYDGDTRATESAQAAQLGGNRPSQVAFAMCYDTLCLCCIPNYTQFCDGSYGHSLIIIQVIDSHRILDGEACKTKTASVDSPVAGQHR